MNNIFIKKTIKTCILLFILLVLVALVSLNIGTVKIPVLNLILNPVHPSLGHKKMAGQEDIFEIRISKNHRLTYQKIGDIAYLRKVGTHDLLRDP